MCLSLNAIAMQNEGNQANASGLTSSSNVVSQQHVPVSLDRFMAMMEKQDARIEKLHADGITERTKQDAERAEHKIDIEKLHARIEKLHADGITERTKQDAERAEHKIDIEKLRAELAEQNIIIRGLLAEQARQNATIGELLVERAARTEIFNNWQSTMAEQAAQEVTKRLGAEQATQEATKRLDAEPAARRTTRRAGNDETTK